MNREIKFRGRRLDNGEWVYGYFFASQMSGAYILSSKIEARKSKSGGMMMRDKIEQYEVDPATVGQFIGLKDNHNQGNQIYKSDIVRITAACGEEYIGEVVWDELRAGWSVDIGEELWDFASIIHCEHLVEVIGNVWDNPELLEHSNA